MLERYAAQDARLAKGRGRINEKRGLQLWEEVISGLKGMDPVTQIKEINSYFNAFTYQSDAKKLCHSRLLGDPVSVSKPRQRRL
jgi:hypothetical protein